MNAVALTLEGKGVGCMETTLHEFVQSTVVVNFASIDKDGSTYLVLNKVMEIFHDIHQ